MSRLTELEKWPGHTELILPCDGHDGDYLRLTWDEDDTDWRYLWIEESSLPTSLRKRIVSAWKTLLGQRVESKSVVLADEAVRELRDFLSAPEETR